MPERTNYKHGVPNYVDLMSNDPDASCQFYGGLFGWTFDPQPTPEGPIYNMAQKNGKAVAGIGPLPPDMVSQGVPPMWNSYVNVDDVDKTLAQVEGAGGVVMMPAMDVMDAGRMAGLVDPTGAALMLWQANQYPGSELVNEHGTFTWSELMTPDVDKAAAFYHAIFGWDADTADMGGMEYTSFTVDGDSIAGAMKPPMDGIPPHWGIYFSVDDCDATVAAAQAAGGTAMAEPTDVPTVGRMCPLVDPIGAMFSVMQPEDPSAVK